MRQVTIKDIAQIAGVSYSTVSRALSGSSEVSEATRSRILEICNKEGYRVNALARGLISNKTNMIGVIVPDVSNPFFSDLVFNIEKCAKNSGYTIMLCNNMYNTNETHDLFDLLLGYQVDGIIVAGSNDEAITWMNDYIDVVPFLLIGDALFDNESCSFNTVSIDNKWGGYLAGKYLCELGHRKIAYLGLRRSSIVHRARFDGFCESLEQYNISPIVLENLGKFSSMTVGYELGKELLSNKTKCTSVFASSDTLALGTMQAADEFKISIPEDLSLIGFDNIVYTNLPRIGITTIDQRTLDLAKTAVELLLKIISNEEENKNIHSVLKPKLVERTSCIVLK